jgi:hypothetical protein
LQRIVSVGVESMDEDGPMVCLFLCHFFLWRYILWYTWVSKYREWNIES